MSQEQKPVSPQPEQPRGANDVFQDILAEAAKRVANATGVTPEDFKYGQAGSVREADIPGYVYVTVNGREYGPTQMTWGSLDGDKEKSTALVNAKDEGDPNAQNNWTKVWFKDGEVQKSPKKR